MRSMEMLPLLSESLFSLLKDMASKESDPIVEELIRVNSIYEATKHHAIIPPILQDLVQTNIIDTLITDEVRMITFRGGDDMDVSFLPNGKEPEYTPDNKWARRNRQTGKPAKIFKKLLVKEFKTAEWEKFSNLFKSYVCGCDDFRIVEGEDIRKYYCDEMYYECKGTLGNSCMRYSEAGNYFDIYVDNAKLFISLRNGLVTGRALLWQVDDITIMDRVYTCFDYLEDCFYTRAKESGWWIRDTNSLLSTGCTQYWLTPEDNYENYKDRTFKIKLKRDYSQMPYLDSFRYYDGDRTITNDPTLNFCYSCDTTDGELIRSEIYECAGCGATYRGYDDETPEELYYSDYADEYYCENCCSYCDFLSDYIPSSVTTTEVCTRHGWSWCPEDYASDNCIENPTGHECPHDIVMVNDQYYEVNCGEIRWNEDHYELCDTT